MGIQIISISHKIAPLHVREMFAFTEEQQKHMMQKITEHLEVSECIVFLHVTGQKCMCILIRKARDVYLI